MPAKPNPEKDERVSLPLDPEAALRALLAVDPDEPAKEEVETTDRQSVD